MTPWHCLPFSHTMEHHMKAFDQPLARGTRTVVAIARHPLHPMLVTFPIAFFVAVLGTDLAFWYLNDPFWARASLWLLGGGLVMGGLAAVAGTVELLVVGGIRRRPAGWNHFVMAVMLLAVEFVNWWYRLPDAPASIVPGGLCLSAMGVVLVAAAGWMGAHLIFEHQVAIAPDAERTKVAGAVSGPVRSGSKTVQ